MPYEYPRESKIRYKHIVKRLLKAASETERAQAAHDLRHYRESSIVKPLLQALQDPSEQVRWQALQSLRQRYFRLERFAKYVIPLLEDDSPQVQVAVVDGLFEMIDGASMQAILFDVLGGDDRMAKIDALALLPGLIQVKGVAPMPIVAKLLAFLHVEPLALRITAAQALGFLKVEAAVDPIMRKLLQTDNPDAQVAAIQALGAINTSEAVDALLDCLQQKVFVDETAAALAMTSDPRTVEPLLAQLQQDPRLSIVDALGRLGDDRAIEPLAALLQQSAQWPEIAGPILAALRLINSPKARQVLAEYK